MFVVFIATDLVALFSQIKKDLIKNYSLFFRSGRVSGVEWERGEDCSVVFDWIFSSASLGVRKVMRG